MEQGGRHYYKGKRYQSEGRGLEGAGHWQQQQQIYSYTPQSDHQDVYQDFYQDIHQNLYQEHLSQVINQLQPPVGSGASLLKSELTPPMGRFVGESPHDEPVNARMQGPGASWMPASWMPDEVLSEASGTYSQPNNIYRYGVYQTPGTLNNPQATVNSSQPTFNNPLLHQNSTYLHAQEKPNISGARSLGDASGNGQYYGNLSQQVESKTKVPQQIHHNVLSPILSNAFSFSQHQPNLPKKPTNYSDVRAMLVHFLHDIVKNQCPLEDIIPSIQCRTSWPALLDRQTLKKEITPVLIRDVTQFLSLCWGDNDSEYGDQQFSGRGKIEGWRYPCPFAIVLGCGMVAKESHRLREHLEKEHPEWPKRCELCGQLLCNNPGSALHNSFCCGRSSPAVERLKLWQWEKFMPCRKYNDICKLLLGNSTHPKRIALVQATEPRTERRRRIESESNARRPPDPDISQQRLKEFVAFKVDEIMKHLAKADSLTGLKNCPSKGGKLTLLGQLVDVAGCCTIAACNMDSRNVMYCDVSSQLTSNTSSSFSSSLPIPGGTKMKYNHSSNYREANWEQNAAMAGSRSLRAQATQISSSIKRKKSVASPSPKLRESNFPQPSSSASNTRRRTQGQQQNYGEPNQNESRPYNTRNYGGHSYANPEIDPHSCTQRSSRRSNENKHELHSANGNRGKRSDLKPPNDGEPKRRSPRGKG